MILILIKSILVVFAITFIILAAYYKRYITSLAIGVLAIILFLSINYFEYILDNTQYSYISDKPYKSEYILTLNDNDSYYIEKYNNGFLYRKFSPSITNTQDTFIPSEDNQIDIEYNNSEDPKIEYYKCTKTISIFSKQSTIYKIYLNTRSDIKYIDNNFE
jgi:hypothetical protein